MMGRQEASMVKSPNPNLFTDHSWLEKEWDDGVALPTRDIISQEQLDEVSHVFGKKAGDTCWINRARIQL
jgi:hypothetical protein